VGVPDAFSSHPVGFSGVGFGVLECFGLLRTLRKGTWQSAQVQFDELFGQSLRRLLPPHLEDRFEVFRYLAHRVSWHVREDVALEMYYAPLPDHSGQLAKMAASCPRGRRLSRA
jgi:hypothetical protein